MPEKVSFMMAESPTTARSGGGSGWRLA
jgi:hypothetical protein